MEKLTSIELPVKMTLHSVTPKQNFLRSRKQLVTTVKPAAFTEIPLQLSTHGWGIHIKLTGNTELLDKVSLLSPAQPTDKGR